MTFKTTLDQAVQSAGAIYVNGFQTDSDMLKRIGANTLEIDLRQYNAGVFAVPANQQVEIDEHGDASLSTPDGQSMRLSFQVAAPLTADLVAKAI